MTANPLSLSQRALTRIIHGASLSPLISEIDADSHLPFETRTNPACWGFSDCGRVHGDPLWTAGTRIATVDVTASLAVNLNLSELPDEPAITEPGETEPWNGAAASASVGAISATAAVASTSEARRRRVARGPRTAPSDGRGDPVAT